jgi:hypothetical protein
MPWIAARSLAARAQKWLPSIVLEGVSGFKVWMGTSYQVKPVKEWNGTAWVARPVKDWNGAGWLARVRADG